MSVIHARKAASDDLGPTLVAVCWVFAALAFVVIAVRCFVRLRIVQRFNIDDWFILLTYALALGNSAFCTVAVHFGLGQHLTSLSPYQVKFSIKYVYLCEFFSIMSPCFGRISFAFLLMQLVPPTKWPNRFLWTVVWLQFAVDIATVIVSFAQCWPISDFWENPEDKNCWSPKVQLYTGFFQGSVCSLVDLILALFPTSLFWNLNMKISTKISLSILMGLGVFAMVCSIKKTIELRAIDEKDDPTYAMCDLAIWWTLEAYMVLLAASIPTLRPLAKLGATKRSAADSGSGGSYSLRNRGITTIGSYPTRRKGDNQFYMLSETQQTWTSEEGMNKAVAEQGSIREDIENTAGISKTTTVTVSEHDTTMQGREITRT
ncbi:integral membrane protein [Dendryphion nanum]|uniref:Integral membrane protein n=1 Tax=Dendryphion nanum TaxID=256645 RepID=A0A9P9DMU6_9PLEO|nr:integral membrane protein [Dendryphion nanum]